MIYRRNVSKKNEDRCYNFCSNKLRFVRNELYESAIIPYRRISRAGGRLCEWVETRHGIGEGRVVNYLEIEINLTYKVSPPTTQLTYSM